MTNKFLVGLVIVLNGAFSITVQFLFVYGVLSLCKFLFF